MPDTNEKPKGKRGRPKKIASPYAQTFRLEAVFPQVINEGLSIPALAKRAHVGPDAARNFLIKKNNEISRINKDRLLNVTAPHAAAINETASRQMRRLEKLNAIPDEEWTQADRAMEKHTLACLKAVHPLLAIAAAASPTTLQPLKSNNDTGDSPSSDDDTEEITQDDGM